MHAMDGSEPSGEQMSSGQVRSGGGSKGFSNVELLQAFLVSLEAQVLSSKIPVPENYNHARASENGNNGRQQ